MKDNGCLNHETWSVRGSFTDDAKMTLSLCYNDKIEIYA